MSCERCGSCCVQYDGNNFATEEDIRRWVYGLRHDILQFCGGWREWCFGAIFETNAQREKVISHLLKDLNDVVWFDPLTQGQLDLCPFLRKKYGKPKFECLIYDTRPKACREYFCEPNDMRRIVKKSFEENLKEYRKNRKYYRSIKKFGGLIPPFV